MDSLWKYLLFYRFPLLAPLREIWGLSIVHIGLSFGSVLFWLGVGIVEWEESQFRLYRFIRGKVAFQAHLNLVVTILFLARLGWLLGAYGVILWIVSMVINSRERDKIYENIKEE